MTTRFLQTESGEFIAAKFIVRIGGLNSRPQFSRFWHEIDYMHGNKPRSTTATEGSVAEFLDTTDTPTESNFKEPR